MRPYAVSTLRRVNSRDGWTVALVRVARHPGTMLCYDMGFGPAVEKARKCHPDGSARKVLRV